MHFYLPRRHRRPLLFPPGLLALAGLLWLGCVALGPWQDKLTRRGVMQLTMVPRTFPLQSDWPRSPYFLPLYKLDTFRPWRDITINGIDKLNEQEQAHIINHLHAIMADSGHQGGGRVCFAPTAHYKNLIFVLGLMNREKSKRYWLDVINKPVTFYTITKPRHRGEYTLGPNDMIFSQYLRWSGRNGQGESNFPLSWKQQNQPANGSEPSMMRPFGPRRSAA